MAAHAASETARKFRLSDLALDLVLSARAPSDPIEALAQHHAAAGLDLEPISLMPQHWNGDPIDDHEIVHALAIQTFGDLPHDLRPRATRIHQEDNDGRALGLNDAAYDTWAIEWRSDD